MNAARQQDMSTSDNLGMKNYPQLVPIGHTNKHPAQPEPGKGCTLLSSLKGLIMDSSQTDVDGNINLEKTKAAVLLHLIESKAHLQKQLQEINVHLE